MAVYHQEEFLDQLAAKLNRPRIKKAPDPIVLPHSCHEEVMATATSDELKHNLLEYSEKTLGAMVKVTTRNDFPQAFIETCRHFVGDSKEPSVVSGDSRLTDLLDDSRIRESGLAFYIWNAEAGYEENIRYTEAAKVGVVFAEQAMAESGTIVLYSSPVQGRAISLLPETSIFVIPKSALVPRVTQACRLLHEKASCEERLPSCVNFISGPSSTADIELIKVVGVHGPINACYMIIDDE
ncbi:MAG: Lactate utilization protein C [Candidatus Celerinatantimonas neptuna]|nr:MAG: Lactate utilization protein C [Candidatus Celerinatantimonas neptuna]